LGDRGGGVALGYAHRRDRARRRAESRRTRQSPRLLHCRPPRLSCRLVRASVLRLSRPARPDGAQRKKPRVRASRIAAVERWTPESHIAVAAAAIIIAVLAVGPVIFSANAADKLTTLFVYVILALMWNALVGFCGLVSIGQQAFFGLGAYAVIRLANWGVG